MMEALVISVDGACSGRRCACAAVLMRNGRVIAESSRSLPEAGGYILAAEIAGVALAARLVEWCDENVTVIIETDNPDVPRVIEQGYRPLQAHRIPPHPLDMAVEFARKYRVAFSLLPRNTTSGLRRAHRLASHRLWARRRRLAKGRACGLGRRS